MQLALASAAQEKRGRFRLPPAVPPFSTRTYRIFTLIWMTALLLAIVGPAMGIYYRYAAADNNSQLVLGSRAGFGVAPGDATKIRFAVGPEARRSGIRPGDDIIAIYGLPLPAVMPVSEQALADNAEDPAYIAMGNLLYGTDSSSEVPLTVRGTDGRTREVVVVTGEQHIDSAARSVGLGPKLLSFIDILHVLFYPFLLWAAWILHRRNARDAVSSILSLAVLLTISAEQPSSFFLAAIGVPRVVNVGLFDLGNICLLAGILLFPHGRLSVRLAVLLAFLPVLLFLHGQLYQSVFIGFMIIAVLLLLRCLRQTPSSDLRQQIRWALLGFSGYALLRGVSILADSMKWWTETFATQMLVEVVAGLSFAAGVLVLQLGLLIALLRYRLYDAEVVISRSANFALITVLIGGIFAAANEGVKVFVQGLYGPDAGNSPGIFAAAVATVAVTPLYDKIQTWSAKKFQRNLFLLRDDLPECVRDLRETATTNELIEEVLLRIERGVRAVRSAAIVNGKVVSTRGVSAEEVEEWRQSREGQSLEEDSAESKDRLFPVRLPLVPSSDDVAPIGYILVGPRPDGTIASKDEQNALNEISESIARGIRNVIKREARERLVMDRIEANARRIEALEALLAGRSSPTLKQAPGPA
ncbi:hypothetical protein H9L13_06030 [Sphingomonas lutea]|uniref:PDZ domain-containing protein n=1 Tax=Sphingomonas lutea TaxID=1045317 RepID=A0A7G9SKN7_9SPHN|nr:hypothetical protein [Sphingomonas lutea]QNN68412.1 hypothetical protein H9L13_06030 [Sphingomonas lutea]